VSGSVEHNPYSATGAPLEVAGQAVQRMRKPVAVWITQILGCACGALVAVGIYRSLRAVFLLLKSNVPIWTFIPRIGFGLFVFALFVIMTIQLQRRSRLGRWLSIIFVSLVLLIPTLQLLATRPGPDGTVAWWIGNLIGAFLTFALIGSWLYAIGFSRKARAWFTKTAHVPDPSAPG
jgi:hypothetical protein